MNADDGVRVWLDDKLVIDSWTVAAGWKTPYTHTAPTTSTEAEKWKRIRVDYYDDGGGASVRLYWTPPGGTRVLVPGSQLTPGYGFTTSVKTNVNAVGTTPTDAAYVTSTTEYTQPHYGQATAETTDAGGLNLRTETDYEPGGLRRRTARRLPKDAVRQAGTPARTQVDYAYYGDNENPPALPAGCASASNPAVKQPHMLKQTLEPTQTINSPTPGGRIDRRYAYDARGRTIATSDDAGASWSCTQYDTRGRVVVQRDRGNKTTTTSYLEGGRVISVSYTDSAGGSRSSSTELDLLGSVVKYTDEWGTITDNVYDQAGRMTETYRTYLGQLRAKLWAAQFDTFGRPSGLVDHLSGTARTTTYGYDTAGRLSTLTRPNGVVTTNTHDANSGRVTGINHTRNSTGIVSWTGTHLINGDVGTETTAGRTRAYDYDGAGRLTEVNDAGTIRRYAYDENTNRCGLGTTCDPAAWVYDHDDRLIASPGTTYDYDQRGNTLHIIAGTAVTTFGYSNNNHATVIDDPQRKTEETVAPDGRVLVRKVTNKSNNTVVEHLEYGYDDKSDSPAYIRPAGGGTITTYIDGPGGLLAIQAGSTVKWPLANARGDIIGNTDHAGTYTANPVVDEFGVGTVTTDRLGWLGTHQRYTVATTSGIVRMGHRLYDPRIGRFLQVDPVEGGSANDYDYVEGDPINAFDLDGLWVRNCARRARRAASAVGRFASRHRDAISTGLAVAGMIGCAICGAVGIGLSAYSTYRSCRRGDGVGCALGVASLGLGGLGSGLGRAGRVASRAGGSRAAASRWRVVQRRVTGPALSRLGGSLSRNGRRLQWSAVGIDAVNTGRGYWR